MKTIIVKETDSLFTSEMFTLDLNSTPSKNCLGCWTCWWTTPGKCVHNDLDQFYRKYIASDKAIFLANITCDFVSGNMKNLFDRMICLFLPYTVVSKNRRTRHLPRYDKYPDIEFYYEGKFSNEVSKHVFYDYIDYVFKEFYSKNVTIKPISEFNMEAIK